MTKSRLVIASILAATMAVTGLSMLGSGAFTSTAHAQGAEAPPVVVVNPSSQPVPAGCPRANVQHWDKIVFGVKKDFLDDHGDLTFPLVKGGRYDIKVLDDPQQVADLKNKVGEFLRQHSVPIFDPDIIIVDVDYAIVCVIP